MRLRAGTSRRRAERITLNLASMIDVVFLLLIYLMVSMVLVAPEDKLSPTLQTVTEEATGSAADFEPQVVDVAMIDGRPAYRIGGIVMTDRAQLEATLRALPKTPGVFVRVSASVPVGFAVAAVQTARDAGFDQVTYVPADA